MLFTMNVTLLSAFAVFGIGLFTTAYISGRTIDATHGESYAPWAWKYIMVPSFLVFAFLLGCAGAMIW